MYIDLFVFISARTTGFIYCLFVCLFVSIIFSMQEQMR